MSDLVDWLEERPQGWGYARLILISLFAALLLSITSSTLLTALNAPTVSHLQASAEPIEAMGENCVKIMTWKFWIFLAMAAMFEELLFRLLPLGATALITALILYLVNKYTGRDIDIGRAVIVMAMIVAVPCSMYFGYGHGNIFNLFIQGISGYIHSLLYIKCGGVSEELFTGLLASSTMHFIFNGIVFLSAALSGMAYLSFDV